MKGNKVTDECPSCAAWTRGFDVMDGALPCVNAIVYCMLRHGRNSARHGNERTLYYMQALFYIHTFLPVLPGSV